MKKLLPLWSLIILLALLELILYPQRINMNQPELFDPDCYMRLLQVEQLCETHDWFNHEIARSNAPYGEVLHWSRLLDLILAGGGYVAAPFVGVKTGLFWWGMMISPLLQLFSLATLYWSAIPILNLHGRLRLCLLFLGQLGAWNYFFAGRPDHHSLLLFLFIVTIGCTMRSLTCHNKRRYSLWSGLIAAMSIWVSVEALAVVAMVNGTLAVLWLRQKDGHYDYAKQGLNFSLSLLSSSIVFTLVERPLVSLMTVEYDKLSVVHLLLFSLMCIFWLVVSRKKLVSPINRFATTVLFAVVSLNIVQFFFPDFFKGPFASVDPRIVPLWLNHVNEVQPLLSLTWDGLSQTVLLMGICLPACFFLFYNLVKQRSQLSDQWVLWLVGAIIFVPLAFYQLRWAAYGETILVFPLALLLDKLLSHLATIKHSGLRTLARVFLTLLFCLGFLVAGVLLSSAVMKDHQIVYTITRAITVLNDLQGLGSVSKTILTDLDFGPEILYRTNHRVIATPYHRNGAGIMLLYEVMTAESDEEARTLLNERVDLIVQQSRLQDGSRRITHLTEVQGIEGEVVTLQDIFVFEQMGKDENNKIVGRFKPTGIRPKFLDKLSANGIYLPNETFWPKGGVS